MKQIKGNILNTKKGIICQQVNCQGVMGSGLALQIRNKWPYVYKQYKECHTNGHVNLGNIIIVPVEPDIYVANLCGQNSYGREAGRVYTNYNALNSCFESLAKWHKEHNPDLPIYIPYKISCGLAGGNWVEVVGIIEKHIPDAVVVRRWVDAKDKE